MGMGLSLGVCLVRRKEGMISGSRGCSILWS